MGEEYPKFLQSYSEETAVDLRVNTLKLSAADFSTLSPFVLMGVGAHEPERFLVMDDSRPGSHQFPISNL